jgi:uncharacterized protein
VLNAWEVGNENADGFVTTNYVALESVSVGRRRWGLRAVTTLVEDFLPLVDLLWVGEDDHAAAVDSLLTSKRRQFSLVDCVSFAVMRRLGIREYLALDPHFAEQGFRPYRA